MRLTVFVFCIAVLSSCKVTQSLKKMAVLKKGHVQAGYFLQEIPFELVNNLVVLKVTIRGKTYSFVFDTGAPVTVLTKELAAELQLKSKVRTPVGDATGNQLEADWALIDTVNIAGVNFYDAPCISSDIKAQQAFGCMNFDGLLGASLMRHAVWAFDFQRNMVIMTNSAVNLPAHLQNGTAVSFDPTKTYTPLIDIEVDGKKTGGVINFDMGSAGTLQLGRYYFKEKNKLAEFSYSTYSIGNNSIGLHGSGTVDTTFYNILPISLAGHTGDKQLVTYKKSGPTIIGMQWMKNFNFILNWFNRTITFSAINEVPVAAIPPFGFSYRFNTSGELFISEIIKGSDAEGKGLMYGDIIVSINGRNLQQLTKEVQCDIILNGAYSKKATQLNIVIMKNGGRKELTVGRSVYNVNR